MSVVVVRKKWNCLPDINYSRLTLSKLLNLSIYYRHVNDNIFMRGIKSNQNNEMKVAISRANEKKILYNF